MKSRKPQVVAIFMVLAVAVLSFGYYRYQLPIPSPAVSPVLATEQAAESPDIPWPAAQASVGTVEGGVLASKPGQVPRPTASAAKLITVLTVLDKKPLALGDPGPIITMSQRDMALYDSYFRANGSLVAVRLGEQLSQYQMLQGVLIRSANNLADSLAIWAFGSLGEYQKAAQSYVGELGMKNTTVGTDASGLSPTTISTAEDLTLLGIAAMEHPVVREIVRQSSSTFPTDGTKPNTNWLLGQNGVVGIKTGNLPAIGGVFVIASEYAPEGGEPLTIVGSVQGAQTGYDAVAEAGQLVEAIKPLFVHRTLVEKGTLVATISSPWGESSNVVAAEGITKFGWKYEKSSEPEILITSDAPIKKGAVVGSLTIGDQSVELIATSHINPPSWQWRLMTSR